MADRKNQHFVPRCVLKPFSLDGEGRAIHLYAVAQRKLIEAAPLKNQCSRDYFYGKDGQLEQLLGELERGYANAVRRVVRGEDTEVNRNTIRRFTYLQLRRTETAVMAMMQGQAQIVDDVFGNREDRPAKRSRDWFLLLSLRSFSASREYVEDLKVRVVENHTKIDFVICDDPAVLMNRLAKQRLNDYAFGVMSSGLIMTMPLTPRLAILCYDGQVYTVPTHVNGRMVLRDTSDVESLNEVQHVKATAGVYYSQWADRDYVSKKFEAVRNKRPESWMRITHMPFVGDDGDGGSFREGTLEEAKAAGRSLVTMGFNYPAPSNWLSQLKFRAKPKTFFNGTAIGHVRQEEWLHSDSTRDAFQL